MNLSNKLTFSLVFSVLLVVGFAFVPTAMAAEGGPTVESIVLDASMTAGDADGPDDDAATTEDAVPAMDTVSNGMALLTTSASDGGETVPRAILVDTAATGAPAGTFRLILTFSENVYPNADARPDAPNDPTEALRDQSASRAINANDILPAEISIISALGIATGTDVSASVSVSDVTRVLTADPTPEDGASGDEVYSPTRFYVTIQVAAAAYTDLPINIALAVNTDAVFGIGANRVISPFKDAQPGLGNVGYATAIADRDAGYRQDDFVVIARAVSMLTVTADPDRAIKSSERVTLTLTFDPALHDSDVPTRTNIMVDGGSILADDPATTNDDGTAMDDGFYEVPPAEGSDPPDPANNTMWKIVIVPEGGTGVLQRTITVSNRPGAAFTLNQQIMVDDRTPDPGTPTQGLTITGTAPADGEVFTVTITYSIAPAVDLTEAAISTTNGSIVADTFSGSGTTYTVDIDPNNPTADNPVTVTVSVGQFSQEFMTSATPVTPVDNNPQTIIELTVGIDSKDYLVVAPTGATSTGMADSGLPTSVTPTMVNNMPNLYDLLFGGGTISVYVTADSDNNTADIVINEVMWARDEGAIGRAGETSHQWIELYNNSAHDAVGGSITLQFRPRVAPETLAAADYGSRTDRLSNIERVGTTTGWRISSGKGQNGDSTEGSLKKFISMYRKGDKLGDNDGVNGGHWIQSTELSHVNHIGTPGAVNTVAEVPVTTRSAPSAYTPPKSHVLINEVHNNSNNDLDWLELRFLQKTNVNEWTLSYIKTDLSEHEIMRFPNREFQAGDIVLIVNKGPSETGLAAGQDVAQGGNQARGAGPHKYWNPSNGNRGSGHYLDIPDYNSGNFLLILRTGKGWERWGSRDRLHDAVGRATLVKRTLKADSVEREPHTGNPGQIWETNTWPINGQNLIAHNARGSNNGNAMLEPDRNFAVGSVFARNGTNHGWRKGGISNPGNRGGLGYDRGVVANGTPGYDNGIVKGKSTDLANGTVVISELMLTTDNGRYPQYIELHNTSDNTVQLEADTDGNGARQGWSIRVENHRSGTWDTTRRDRLHVEVRLKDLGLKFIPPNQTVLIVADRVANSGRDNSNHFPDHRVGSLWASGNPFKMKDRRDTFLNAEGGFLLELVDGSGTVSDVVGNLDGKRPDIFDTTNVDFDDPYSWNWPTDMVGNKRTSLIRLRDAGVVRSGVPDRTVDGDMTGMVLPMGTSWRGNGMVGMGMDADGNTMMVPAKYAGAAWVHASDTKRAKAQATWYGSSADFGTPGHTTSTPLPVSLSFFRPTLEDGQVVIRWTTESELDNAGFNIYRSESRNGEFKQVNDKLIQGKGTTAERSNYKWVDTSAKPGVEYYYQIEDVSFAGERETLRTTKMKGLVSADDKLTTKWGELKEVQ